MGTSQRTLITGLGYLALLVLGLVQGLIGSFQYARSPAPLFAIILILILFATCVLAGWGLRTYAGRHPPGPRLDHRLVHPRDAAAERQRDHPGQRGWGVVPLRRRAGGGGKVAVSFYTWMRTKSRSS